MDIKKDLSIGIDFNGDIAIFIEKSHIINEKEVDFTLCIIDTYKSFINLSSKKFRLIDNHGNQLDKCGWIKCDKIIKWN
jgi:hypothetical protein